MNFNERCKVKKQLNNRLKSDGFWNDYNELRAHLKLVGVPEGEAWRVAAYPFSPKNGAPAEILTDPMYAEIAAGWAKGRYSLPDETSSPVATSDTAPTTDKPSVADAWTADWERLAAEVGNRTAGEVEEIRWVVANYLTPVTQLSSDEVPSSAALSILSWVKASASNFGDFLRSSYVKILPDKRELEHQNRFVDDGRDLDRLADFMRREQDFYPSQLIPKIDQPDLEGCAPAAFMH